MSEMLRRFVAALEQTERLPPAAMRRYQERLLVPLVRHAMAHVPFYRDSGRLAGVVRADDSIDWERWAAVPILRRRDIAAHADALLADQLPDEHRPTHWLTTSGSTGVPLRIQRTSLSVSAWAGQRFRLFRWHGFDMNAPIAVFTAPTGSTETVTATGWNRAALAMGYAGLRHQRTWTGDAIDHLAWVSALGAGYIMTHPSHLGLLAHAVPAGSSRRPLGGLITVGETLTDAARAAAVAAFGAAPVDIYACQECGNIAFSCPYCRQYHGCTASLLLEVLDSHNKPLPAVGSGRPVLTALYDYAMPLLRYDIGDIVTLGEPGCVNTAMAIARVEGKQRHQFRRPNGGVLFPATSAGIFVTHLDPQAFQVAQIAPATIEIRVVPGRRTWPDMDFDGCTDVLRRLWGDEFTVRFREVSAIDAAIGGKSPVFVCELADAET